jgi:hypothetical protein
MRILRELSPLQIVIDQKRLENVEYFNYLGSMITRCIREIKSKIIMTKAAFKMTKTFHQQNALKFKPELSNVLQLEHSFVWC